MNPKKKIPNFCFESPHLKPFNLDLDSVEVTVRPRTLRASWTPQLTQDLETQDIEEELTRLLSEEINRELNRSIVDYMTRDLVPVLPLGEPRTNLFYYDYNYGAIEEPVVYDDGSWSIGDTFEGSIGIKSEIKLHHII
jgi:hypothetical protein